MKKVLEIEQKIKLKESFYIGEGVQKIVTILKKTFPILIHLFVWVTCLLLLYYLQVIKKGIPDVFFWKFIAFSIVTYPAIFYAYYLYFVPEILEKNKILYFLLISLGLVLFMPVLAIHYAQYLKNTISNLPQTLHQNNDYITHYLQISIRFLLLIVVASGTKIATDRIRSHRIKVSLTKQNALSETALLRSQINPHFLFNTLNGIYSLTYKKDDNAPRAVLKLSELMRYMLYDASEEQVSLEKEVNYVKGYIELQRLRLKDPFQVVFDVQGDYLYKMIPPMLLIPFIENAFKHGISLSNPCDIYFGLCIEDNFLYFKSVNSIVKPTLINKGEVEKGIGHENVRKRLQLLYPDKHELRVKEEENKYFVNLTIKL